MYASVQFRGMTTLSISAVRAALPAVLDRVAAGEEVTITRHGHPIAVIVRPDALRSRRADQAFAAAADVAKLLRDERQDRLPAAIGLSTGRADELVAAVRAGRDGG